MFALRFIEDREVAGFRADAAQNTDLQVVHLLMQHWYVPTLYVR